MGSGNSILSLTPSAKNNSKFRPMSSLVQRLIQRLSSLCLTITQLPTDRSKNGCKWRSTPDSIQVIVRPAAADLLLKSFNARLGVIVSGYCPATSTYREYLLHACREYESRLSAAFIQIWKISFINSTEYRSQQHINKPAV